MRAHRHSRERPNIVVLVADDHRGGELGHLGGQARTPSLDRLASRGTSFAQAHCQGGMMGAICAPSRATLMTGRNILTASRDPGAADFLESIAMPADLETFPQALRAAGYRTHAIGKWHNDTASFQRSFVDGEAIMFLGMSDHDKVPVWDYHAGGRYRAAQRFRDDGADSGQGDESVRRIADGFSTDIFADAAIRFLDGHTGDDPFLLYVAFTAPHDPRTPPPGWEVDPADVDLPPNAWSAHPFDNGDMEVRDERLAAMPRDPAEVRQHLADYYGMIAHLDHAVGRILDAIEANGLGENTVVIYTADHGLAVGQHGLMGKQNLYEHSLRVPLVIAGPGVPQGIVSHDLVWHADTNATIRALAGVAADPASEGVALVDQGRVVTPRSGFGAAYAYCQRMYRNERYKLIRYCRTPSRSPTAAEMTPGSDEVQLFDLARDPWEQTNLASEPGHRDMRRELEEGLDDWQRAVGDVLLAYHR